MKKMSLFLAVVMTVLSFGISAYTVTAETSGITPVAEFKFNCDNSGESVKKSVGGTDVTVTTWATTSGTAAISFDKTDKFKGTEDSVLCAAAKGTDGASITIGNGNSYYQPKIKALLTSGSYDYVTVSFDVLLGAERNSICFQTKMDSTERKLFIENAESTTNVWTNSSNRAKLIVDGGVWHRIDILMPWYGEGVMQDGKLKTECSTYRIFVDGTEKELDVNYITFPEVKPTTVNNEPRIDFVTQTNGTKTPTYEFDTYIDNLKIAVYNGGLPAFSPVALKSTAGTVYTVDEAKAEIAVSDSTTAKALADAVKSDNGDAVLNCMVMTDCKTAVEESAKAVGNKLAVLDGNGNYKYYTVCSNGVTSNGVMVVSNEDFESGAETTGGVTKYTLTDEQKNMIESGDTMYYEVICSSKDKSGKVIIDIEDEAGNGLLSEKFYKDYLDEGNNEKNLYYITPNKSKICLPYTSQKDEHKLTVSQASDANIVIDSVKLISYGNEKTLDDMLIGQSGMYDLSGAKEYEIVYDGANGNAATDVVCTDSYRYSIGGGKLVIESLADSTKCAELTGLGSLRQIELLNDNTLIVTGRHYGVTVIDVSTPASPEILSRYDSIEFATGLAVYDGKYAFISNRVFGVEVVDMSDPANPKQVSIIRCGEVQSCEVKNGILYTGLWGEHRVDIFDVKDVCNPVKLSSVPLTGRGDGLSVETADGKTYLYAATGHHTYEPGTGEKGSKYLQFGQGNGFDIYDVTNPEAPVWLSTARIDGRYYHSMYDYWTVDYAKNDNKTYLYASSSLNGVYIYDITNREAPVRIAHAAVCISPQSAAYNPITGTDTILPYDQTKYTRSPVGNFCVSNGMMHIAGVLTGVHTFSGEGLPIFAGEDNGGDVTINNGENFYNLPENQGLCNVIQYRCDGEQIQAAQVYNNYIYAACGTGGIKIFDSRLRLLNTVSSGDIVSDVQIVGNRLYAACGKSGLIVYDIDVGDSTTLLKLGSYRGNGLIKQVQVTPNGSWAIVQDNIRMAVLNVSDPAAITVCSDITADINPASVYTRQIMQGFANNRYGVVFGYTKTAYIIDFGEDFNGTPSLVRTINLAAPGVNGGLAAASNGYIISIPSGCGYYLYCNLTDGYITDENGNQSTKNLDWSKQGVMDLTSTPHDDNLLCGKPYVFGNILVVSDIRMGYVTVADIKTINKPELIARFKLNGNPNIAYASDDYVLIPAGYQGLLKINFSKSGDKLIVDKSGIKVTNDNGMLKVGAETGEWSDISGSAVLYFVEYDKDGFLKSVKISDSTAYGTVNSVIEQNLTLIPSKECTYRAFLLDKDTLMPLSIDKDF